MSNRSRTKIPLIVLMLVLLLCVPVALQMQPEAAGKKPGTTKLTAVSSSAYNKITIKWKKTSNATSYNIYYRKNGAKKWIKIASADASKSSYTHKSSSKYPIVVGQKYNYTVRAYNKAAKKSGKYNTKGLTIATVPGTVKLGSAAANAANTAVTVNWSKAAGCDAYAVYRRNTVTPDNGAVTKTEWKRIATVNALSYTDKSPARGEENIYTVRAYYSKTKALGKYDKAGVGAYVKSVNEMSKKLQGIVLMAEEHGSVDLNLSTGSYTISVTYDPADADNKDLTWTSSNPEVATVSNGVVTLIKSGETTITAEASGGISASCYITVIDPEGMIREAIELTNKERIADGKAPLKTNANLQKAAMVRAKELATLFSHTRPNGTNSETAISEAGAAYGGGENIAAGYMSAASVIDGWMNSDGHRVQLLSSRHSYIGIGLYITEDGRCYWTQEFTHGDPDARVTLSFNTMGGSTISALTVPVEAYVDLRNYIPTKAGYTFKGWYSSTSFSTPFNRAYINKNTTAYAKWE